MISGSMLRHSFNCLNCLNVQLCSPLPPFFPRCNLNLPASVIVCLFSDRIPMGGQHVSCISFSLNQQDLLLTGLVVITIISRTIISSHSLQGICEPIWFVRLLKQLQQHHLIRQHSGDHIMTKSNILWSFFIYCVFKCEIYQNLTEPFPQNHGEVDFFSFAQKCNISFLFWQLCQQLPLTQLPSNLQLHELKELPAMYCRCSSRCCVSIFIPLLSFNNTAGAWFSARYPVESWNLTEITGSL